MLPEINAVIIDDEPKALELLKERLSVLFPNINIVGAFSEWKKGMEILKTSSIDLLFLDISMPEKTGIDFLKLFPDMSFQVIFITAHSEFAMEAIKFSAAGYVLKPLDDYELSFAVNKALERVKGGNLRPTTSAQQPASNAVKIGVPNVKGVDYLKAEDILYFESINKYTKVVTKDYSIMSSYNIGAFKKVIDDDAFFQVHRSFIVNLFHIRRYETSGLLWMDDNMQIPVSKNIRTEFLSVFSKITRTAGIKHK
jgi:two-component system LytT family response regulator